jgi:hypothetical protein
MINPHFTTLGFVAIFLAAFGRFSPFDPRLMCLWVPFSIFWPISVDEDTRKDAGQSPVQWQSPSDERKREKLMPCSSARPNSPATRQLEFSTRRFGVLRTTPANVSQHLGRKTEAGKNQRELKSQISIFVRNY